MFRNPYADGLIVLLIVLLFFGPKRLPHLGRSLGEGMREFKDSITGQHKESEETERPELTQATAAPQAAPQTAEAAPAAAQRAGAEVDSNA
jgi:sec-independent protein translocase protein TatA